MCVLWTVYCVSSEARQKLLWCSMFTSKVVPPRVNHSLISRVSHKPLAMNRSYSAVHFSFPALPGPPEIVSASEGNQELPRQGFSLILENYRRLLMWLSKALENRKSTKVRELREYYKSDQNKTAAFCRCQMSDDFSERGHMVNFISGSYWLNWKLNLLFVWKYFPKSRSISIVLLTSITTFQLAAL